MSAQICKFLVRARRRSGGLAGTLEMAQPGLVGGAARRTQRARGAGREGRVARGGHDAARADREAPGAQRTAQARRGGRLPGAARVAGPGAGCLGLPQPLSLAPGVRGKPGAEVAYLAQHALLDQVRAARFAHSTAHQGWVHS